MKKLLDSLTWKQRLSILIAAAGVLIALVTFSHWNRERDFRPLYTGLSTEDAGAVVAKVREAGTEFRLSENGSSISVPSAKVAEMRLQLAAAGVPKSGRIGFELFDKSNFGTSDFAEQVNYHRALEGELERSVMALSEVEQARVHLTFPKDSVFLESRQPAKASVLVKLKAGALLSPQNVAAICQLTASAVEGLAPEAVSVVDMRGNLLNRARKMGINDDIDTSEAALDYKRQVEKDVLGKINSTLEPLLGADRFRATVSADCDLTSGDQSDETFDPTKSVMLTSQKTEDITGGTSSSGVPGTASNLPKPTSQPTRGSNGVTRRTENITYQSSHTVRHVRLPQGTVKRMSVSLLVDNDVRWEGSGAKAKRIVEPPSAEKLKTIHDLVAGVIGFSADRGDQLVVECLPFESTLNPEQMPAAPAPAVPAQQLPPWLDKAMKNKYFWPGVGTGGAVLLASFFLLVRMLRKKAKSAGVEMAAQLASGEPAISLNKQIENQLAEQQALRERQETEALNALKVPPKTKKTEVLQKHIGEQAKKDSTAMAHVLRSWMSEGN